MMDRHTDVEVGVHRHTTKSIAELVLLAMLLPGVATAQVHYHDDGRPWKQRARTGPDAEVPGWFYNLGITGIRAKLVAERPKALLVMYVFDKSPAHGKVDAGDLIVGAGGKEFTEPHKNGYGMDKFGPDGPVLAFADALHASMRRGRLELELELERGKKTKKVELRVGTNPGQFSSSFPFDCPKSDRIRRFLYEYLADQQNSDGSFGNPVHNTFAPLALLGSGERKYLARVKRNVRYHARTTKSRDHGSLINWRYMAAAIVMSEYYLATHEKWVLPELREVYEFLRDSQYTSMSQINPKSRESHPGSVPKDERRKHGGWGHNPGFEGYGPICMITGQGALAFALMKRCGIDVDRKIHDYAYDFLARGTGANGYVWYEDGAAGARNWADMGRTGAAGLANFLSPYQDPKYLDRAREHAKIIGEHPESFPDTHGSPIMGMGYAAAAASWDKAAFRSLMAKNRWWFVLAECCDGTFYYQPNRDNAGYGNDSRLSASAVTAFILTLPQRSLYLSGKGR